MRIHLLIAFVLSLGAAFGAEIKIGMTISEVTNLLGTPILDQRTVTKLKSEEILSFDGGTVCQFKDGQLESFTKTSMPQLEARIKELALKSGETNAAAYSNAIPSTNVRRRPRTIADAKAQRALLTGEKVKQDGGTNQQGRASANAILTGFTEYDRAFIVALQARWYSLLDKHRGKMSTGKVVLEFRLHADGRVSNLKTATNEVGEELGRYCEKAILEPAPYLPWPDAMRRAIAFFYN